MTIEPVPTPPPVEPAPVGLTLIGIEDFAKVKLQVGTITSAEAIPKAKKLLKLQVDLGTETRQIVAGIAEHYTPDQLPGVQVVVVTNLNPVFLRGVESLGMLLAAKTDDTFTLISPAAPIAAGTAVG